jgi:protein-tyrosine-phosphatase/DNA-binding transcriptional ArsR family regulator
MYCSDMVSDSSVTPPAFVQLAGHALRWRLMRELAHSDRRVRELVTGIDQPQNLVSYHLGKLRSAGLVTTRRSAADGRDVYYHLDLTRCAELLAGTAAALHPALRHDPDPTQLGLTAAGQVKVLFLCTGNSARSPMAAALLRHRTGDQVEATSAGSHPKPLHPHAIRALHEYHVDLTGHEPQHLNAFTGRRFDYVISLCDRVREVCPDFPHRPAFIHWSIPDPNATTRGGGDGSPGYAAFRRTAAELDTRIRFLIPVLSDRPRHREVP